MSNFTKGDGAKIAIKFTEELVGDVSGRLEPITGVGWGRNVFEKAISSKLRTNGWMFSPKEDIELTGLMIYTDAAESITMHLWRVSDKKKLIQYTFASKPDKWNLSLIDNPLKLSKGTEYIVTSNNPINGGYMYSNTLTESDKTDFSPHINMIKAYRIDSQNTFPTVSLTGTYTNSIGFSYKIEGMGNEVAFAIIGKERKHIDGDLIDKDYEVEIVERHSIEEKAIILTMKPLQRFNNVEGNLVVKYDANIGNLSGKGGAVESFEHTFTPADLVPKLNPYAPEKITIMPNISADFIKLYYNNRYASERITATPNMSVELIKAEVVNP